MNILLLDIETAPSVAHVWGLFQQNIGITQVVKPGYTLCFAAKWYGRRGVEQGSCAEGDHLGMLRKVHALLDKADIVVHYNGRKFDIPTLNREFVKHGLKPPRPYQQVDLLQVVRRQFRFASNKLDFVAQQLGLGRKHHHKGHQLWVDCMAGDQEAWKEMLAYNKQDVRLTEKLYDKLKPWIVQHPNLAVISGKEGDVCPTCTGNAPWTKKYIYTGAGEYRLHRCEVCHTYSRGRKRQLKPITLTQVRT